MTEYQFFRVDDGIPLLIDHEFVLDNPYELLVREKTTKDIFLRFKNWAWDIKNPTILDYLHFGVITIGGNVHDENHEVVYIVPFTNFGMYDYKFIFKDAQKTHQIFLTTNTRCESVDRCITLDEFEIFNKKNFVGDVSAFVTDRGLEFNVQNQSNVGPEIVSYVLPFANPISGLDRILVYDCKSYKDGVLDFDVLLKDANIWRNINGFSENRGNFSKHKICENRFAYYTSADESFSVIISNDRSKTKLDIFKEICNMVGNSIYLTKNMKSDLELMILRWFSERFNDSNLFLMHEIIRLHNVVDEFIRIAYTLKHLVGNLSDRNSSLYK